MTVDYYDSSGQNLPNARSFFAGVPAGATRRFFPNRLPSDFEGVAIVGSDQPAVATSVLTRATGPLSAVAVQNGALIRPFVSSMSLALPYVANALEATYNTDFAIVNTGTTVACATLTHSFLALARSRQVDVPHTSIREPAAPDVPQDTLCR
jgi:hypothetical protein